MKKRNYFGKAAAVTAVAAMCAALPVLSVCAAQTLAGDVDKNGTVGVSDVAALQKYLLGIHSLDETAYDNANVYADDAVDVFDLGILKRMVLGAEPVNPPSGDSVVASIVFSENSVTLYDANDAVVDAADASNVTVSDNTYVTITKSGDYTVSGTSSNGQIKISTDNTTEPEAKVEMSFEELTLSNATAAPVYVENVGDEAVISAKKGTTSTISDGTSHTDTYTNSEGTVKEITSAIFARDDLKIKGKGTLIVNGNTEDGIVCTKDIKLWNSTLQINAVDDGVRGDTVKVGDTNDATNYETLNVSITTQGGDGIKADSTNAGKGYVTVSGGTLTIKSYADGIQAEQAFTMTGGTVDIYTYEGSSYSGSGSSGGGSWGWGPGGGNDGNSNKTDVSAKGIKAVGLYDEAGTTWQSAGNITISGGTLTVDSSDDCVHAGGNIDLVGGALTLSSSDDAVHADHDLTIGQGNNTFDNLTVIVPTCYEGMEAQNITQNSGTVIVNSTDDGYNAAGGADGSGNMGGGPGGGWGQGSFGGGSYSLEIKGGFALVNATDGDHDGFDSNGSLTISGGYVITNGNEPFDSDGSLSCTGGVWVSNCGSGGMSMGSELSATASASGSISAGTRVSVVDGNGNVIVSWIVDKSVSTFKVGGDVQSGVTFQSGGELSGSTYFQQLDQTQLAAYGGTLSGGTAMTSGSSGGNSGPGGWGGRTAAPTAKSMPVRPRM